MLNNKKNLLQRVRIAMVAIVTIMSIGGAFAFTPHQSKALQTWGVVRTASGNYVVTAVTANSFCEESTNICTVQSTVAPNSAGQIPESQATPSSEGSFHK